MLSASAGDSRLVSSNQTDIHENLFKAVSKHASNPYRRPIARHTQRAFDTLLQTIESPSASIIIDSGCGTGESSLTLAKAHPDAQIVAIDKSEIRLHKFQGVLPANLSLVRAELIDIWQLLANHKRSISDHYVFYPNPWPKAKHLNKRWHGNPVFPVMLGLSPRLTLRTNWRIYAMEFAAAANHLNTLGIIRGTASWTEIEVRQPISAFEKKYLASGHRLFEVKFIRTE